MSEIQVFDGDGAKPPTVIEEEVINRLLPIVRGAEMPRGARLLIDEVINTLSLNTEGPHKALVRRIIHKDTNLSWTDIHNLTVASTALYLIGIVERRILAEEERKKSEGPDYLCMQCGETLTEDHECRDIKWET